MEDTCPNLETNTCGSHYSGSLY